MEGGVKTKPTAATVSPAFSLFTSTVFGNVATKILLSDDADDFSGAVVLVGPPS